MSQNKEPKQAQQSNTFIIPVSFYTSGIDDQGRMIEVKREKQPVELTRLMRRNVAHSKLALDVLEMKRDETALAQEYVQVCCQDEKLAAEIKGDLLACLEIFNSDAVTKDFNRFFEEWEYYHVLIQKATEKVIMESGLQERK